MKTPAIVMAIALAMVVAAQAQEKKKTSKSKHETSELYAGRGYGLAGCGMGSLALGPKPGPIQIFSATLNHTVGSQTFGISSGTSNCEIPEMGVQAAVFIEVNRTVVMKEAARGEGESIESLAKILKCEKLDGFGSAIRSSFSEIFASDNAYTNIRHLMRVTQPFCNNVG